MRVYRSSPLFVYPVCSERLLCARYCCQVLAGYTNINNSVLALWRQEDEYDTVPADQGLIRFRESYRQGMAHKADSDNVIGD